MPSHPQGNIPRLSSRDLASHFSRARLQGSGFRYIGTRERTELMDHQRRNQRSSSPTNWWPGGVSEIAPVRPVQRPPPPVVYKPTRTTGDGASVQTGSSHGSSTIKASRTGNLFSLRFGRGPHKDKSNSDGGSTVECCPSPPPPIDNDNPLPLTLIHNRYSLDRLLQKVLQLDDQLWRL